MKRIKTSTYDFPSIIEKDFLYVDKTDYVWKLVEGGKDEFFLSRPRRFGKSLLVSTLKAVFQGRRELFKGLAIDKADYDWKRYPVIHLDFGACTAKTPEKLEVYLNHLLEVAADTLGLGLRGEGASIRFENLIRDAAKASETGSVVVLVDEYDKPILGNIDIDNKKQQKDILSVLKGFYGVVKTYEGLIRFAFITGVSKFTHVSLFSELNNLTDITLQDDYAGMLGFTEEEIRGYFADRIPLAAETNGLPEEELMRKLLRWYDGYRFSDAPTHVCNPVSISKFFNQGYDFSNYWDDTGTLEFLVRLSREREYDYEAALAAWYDESIFSAYELDCLDITGLLWQTGYLTIKDVRCDEDGMQYRLDFPDKEVQATFSRRLIESFAGERKNDESWVMARQFRTAIREDDLPRFMTLFQSFLAKISYELHIPHEKYYQTIFFIVFKFLDASVEAESCTNEGRIDAYIRTAKKVYIFEFKLNKTAENAIDQIMDRRYYEKFQNGGLPIVLVGVNFDSSKGRIDNWAETTVSTL